MLIWWRTLAHPRLFQGPSCPHARSSSAVRMCCIYSKIGLRTGADVPHPLLHGMNPFCSPPGAAHTLFAGRVSLPPLIL